MCDPSAVLARLAGSSGPDLSMLAREDPFAAVRRKLAVQESIESDRDASASQASGVEPSNTGQNTRGDRVGKSTPVSTLPPRHRHSRRLGPQQSSNRQTKQTPSVISEQVRQRKPQAHRQRLQLQREAVKSRASTTDAEPRNDEAMSTDDFLATLDPSLRRAILAEQLAEFLAGLDPRYAAERREHARRLQANDEPVMFMHHTLSEDLSGSQESIISQRLARLGATSQKPIRHKVREERFGFGPATGTAAAAPGNTSPASAQDFSHDLTEQQPRRDDESTDPKLTDQEFNDGQYFERIPSIQRIYISDLDYLSIGALIGTVSQHQAPAFYSFIYKHLLRRPSFDVSVPTEGLKRFELGFHIPYREWRDTRIPGSGAIQGFPSKILDSSLMATLFAAIKRCRISTSAQPKLRAMSTTRRSR